MAFGDVARKVGGGNFYAVFIVAGRHGVGKGEKADIAAVFLQVAGHKIARHQHTAVAHVFVDGIAHHGSAAPAHVGGQGFNRNARRLRIKAHGQLDGARVALTKTGKRAVCGAYFKLKCTFAQVGVLHGNVYLALGYIFIKMLAVDNIKNIVLAHAHRDGANAGRVLHAHLEHACRRNLAGVGRHIHNRAVQILKKDVATHN